MAMFVKLLARLKWVGRPAAVDWEACGLHNAREFQRVLERERDRADRSGDGFSLLDLSPLEPFWDPKAVRRLGRVLKRRLRLTDDAGLLPQSRVGVALPATPVEGAWKVASDIRDLLGTANQIMAKAADEVVTMHSGIPLNIKNTNGPD